MPDIFYQSLKTPAAAHSADARRAGSNDPALASQKILTLKCLLVKPV